MTAIRPADRSEAQQLKASLGESQPCDTDLIRLGVWERNPGTISFHLASPGLSQCELAAAFGVAPPTATRALHGLAKQRLIERRPSGTDGREQVIHPTGRAIAMGDGLNKASGTETRRLKRRLGEEAFADTGSRLRAARTALR